MQTENSHRCYLAFTKNLTRLRNSTSNMRSYHQTVSLLYCTPATNHTFGHHSKRITRVRTTLDLAPEISIMVACHGDADWSDPAYTAYGAAACMHGQQATIMFTVLRIRRTDPQ